MQYKITALSVQKRNRQRVNVFLDGEFAFGVSRIVAAWLHVGQEIDDEKIAQLRAEDEREVAHQQALKLLNYRPRTEAEVRKRLLEQEVPGAIIDGEIEKLKNSGLLNDASFAQAWIENRTYSKPRSRRALVHELRQHGVDQQTVEQAVQEVDDEQSAYRLATRQVRKLQGQEQQIFYQKMYRFLAQRGFDYETCTNVIERVWMELQNRDNDDNEADT